jgi:peptidoglycan L-alanyl-D-glutamate endopeptidase CwlK
VNLNSISEARLRGVHPDLVRVVRRCARDWKDKEAGFIVTQGLRTMEEQRLLYKKGASRTLKSRHLTGHAVDLACSIKGQVRWDWPLYVKLSKAMKAAAKAEKIPIVWGGDWVSFRDGPHYELPRNKYPA